MRTRAKTPHNSPLRGLQAFWQTVTRQARRVGADAGTAASPARTPRGSAGTRPVVTQTVDIAPDDPLVAYFQKAPNAVELDKLDLQSPALAALRAAGVKLTVPLVSQGELVGLLNLGPRLSEQDYSADDRALLDNLAVQAGPAVRVAQLVREQQAEIQARERLEQELRVARLIQQTLLPKELPAVTGWQLAATYRPARAVGGDFYDFINLQDGRLGIVIGDVTDKGVPAALMMATTRATLRSAVQQFSSPGQVLAQVNDQIVPEIPPKMFITCLYAILDPVTGRIQYANAGHDLPYLRKGNQVLELRATGMPLGLMPQMQYEEREAFIQGGDSILFYTDGLVEAHNPEREMFGFPRLKALMATHPGGAQLIEFLLAELAAFTGPGWEQEDDVSLVTLECAAEPVYVRRQPPAAATEFEDLRTTTAPTGLSPAGSPDQRAEILVAQDGSEARPAESDAAAAPAPARAGAKRSAIVSKWQSEPGNELWRILADFELPSTPGNERQAIERVARAVSGLPLSGTRLERLKTAVGEATMNAMEHGNKYQPELPAEVRVLASSRLLVVQVTDHGRQSEINPSPDAPNLEAKLAGLQTPRGWGLFLIQNLVDDMNVVRDEEHHTAELMMYLAEGEAHAAEGS